MREHNRIANEAAERHPEWTDEQLYQYARRIVIAELQKITYEEFLPSLLGRNAIPRYQGYELNIDPGIAIEFSTAAYRFGHSMLGDDIEFLNNDSEEIRDAMDLRNSFFNPHILDETDIDPILKSLASDNAQEIDTRVVDDVRNFLFGAPGQGGFDLASINISADAITACLITTQCVPRMGCRVSLPLTRLLLTRRFKAHCNPCMEAWITSTCGWAPFPKTICRIPAWGLRTQRSSWINSPVCVTATASGMRMCFRAIYSGDQGYDTG